MPLQNKILLIEDDDGDAELFFHAMVNGILADDIVHKKDGESALVYLRDSNEPNPVVIFLDLNLPGIDGREVLKRIKQDKELKTIPVIVMTTSNNDVDIVDCYESHANCYVRKPVDFNRFVEAIKNLRSVWLSIVTLPPSS